MALRLLFSLAISLGSTLVLELLFAFITGKRGRDLGLVCLVNVLTNPAVVLIYFLARTYTALNPVAITALLEIAAVLVEAAYYKKYGENFRRPLLFSLAANAFSFGIGELIVLLGG